jgi:ABC-type Mn2+/Zn2+ transport system ATPase subunit
MKTKPINFDYRPRLLIKDLVVEIGESNTHFWGVNGSGKSTILRELIKQFQDTNIKYSYLSQNYRSHWLWWYSIRKNLELVLEIDQEITDKSLDSQDLFISQKSWLLPLLDGNENQISLEKQAETESLSLSGGQLQRLLLFRELLRRPNYLFLDEAFSALDEDIVIDIANWLLELQKTFDFKIVSVAHNRVVPNILKGEILNFEVNKETKILSLNKINVENWRNEK